MTDRTDSVKFLICYFSDAGDFLFAKRENIAQNNTNITDMGKEIKCCNVYKQRE